METNFRPNSKVKSASLKHRLVEDSVLYCKDRKIMKEGSYLEMFTSAPDDDFFNITNSILKLLRVIVLFYVMLILRPWQLFLYILKHEQLRKGSIIGTVYTLFVFLVYPFVIVALRIILNLAVFLGFIEKVPFFWIGDSRPLRPNPTENPKGMIQSILWMNFRDLYGCVGMFLVIGNEPNGIKHMMAKHIPDTKQFWRKILCECGANVPDEFGTWNGKEIIWKKSYKNQDLYIKLPDAMRGAGDSALEHGKDIDSVQDVKQYMEEHYSFKDSVLILEWVRPKKNMELHLFSILTVKLPNRNNDIAKSDVQALAVLYHGGATDDKTSHSCRNIYVCDPDEETIVGTASWYRPNFNATNKNYKNLRHSRLKGLKDSVNVAIMAHKKALETYPWMSCIGWDMEITERGPVFFEGNFGSYRISKQLFLSWKHMSKAFQIFYRKY